jgi:hypothetical protein
MNQRHREIPETVYPSTKYTLIDVSGDGTKYKVQECLRHAESGNIIYSDASYDVQYIQFFKEHLAGTSSTGLQKEQVAIALKDHIEMQDRRFPHPEHQIMLQALNEFLEACKRKANDTKKVRRYVKEHYDEKTPTEPTTVLVTRLLKRDANFIYNEAMANRMTISDYLSEILTEAVIDERKKMIEEEKEVKV